MRLAWLLQLNPLYKAFCGVSGLGVVVHFVDVVVSGVNCLSQLHCSCLLDGLSKFHDTVCSLVKSYITVAAQVSGGLQCVCVCMYLEHGLDVSL